MVRGIHEPGSHKKNKDRDGGWVVPIQNEPSRTTNELRKFRKNHKHFREKFEKIRRKFREKLQKISEILSKIRENFEKIRRKFRENFRKISENFFVKFQKKFEEILQML